MKIKHMATVAAASLLAIGGTAFLASASIATPTQSNEHNSSVILANHP